MVPAGDPAVAGYHIYVRRLDGIYTQPRKVRSPVADRDGVLSVVVDGLEVRETYMLAASSYALDGTESPLSNEVRVGYGDVAHLVDSDRDGLSDAAEDLNLNTVLDLGETSPTSRDTDRDGVRDAADRCHSTRADAPVDRAGCPRCHSPRDCYDGDPCTLDACDNGKCRFQPAPDATPCGDGLFCNGLETCQAGTCVDGTPPDCDDGNACTEDGCGEPLGRCIHEGSSDCCTSDADCADTDVCSMNERCAEGTCVSDALPCDGGGACTPATCDPIDGCRLDGRPDATPCENGDPCAGAVCYADTCHSHRLRSLRVQRLRIQPEEDRHRLTMRVAGKGILAIDPTADGLMLELMDAGGQRLYYAELPAQMFRADRSGRVYTLADDASAKSHADALGLERIVITHAPYRTTILARARTGELPEAPRTLVVRSASACSSAIALECTTSSRGHTICR
jgi:hypothetical protein